MFRHRAYSDRRPVSKKIDFSMIEDPLLSQAGLYGNQPSSPVVGRDHPEKPPPSPTWTRADTPQHVDHEENDDERFHAGNDTESESHLVLHTQVYALGEKYDIPSLKQLARQKFEMAAACYYDAAELAEAIELVYQSTIDSDRGLRDVVVQLFRMHPQLAQTQDMYAVIKDTPTLALDLWKVERGLL